ncbi:MAG: hypothetical protein ACRDD7_07785 [Peptostreptococcaceae bacterium]
MTTEIMRTSEVRVNALKEMVEFLENEIKVHDTLIIEAAKQINENNENIAKSSKTDDFIKYSNTKSNCRWEGIKQASEMSKERLQEKLLLTKDAIYVLETDWLNDEVAVDEEYEMWLLEQQEGNFKGGTQSWDM